MEVDRIVHSLTLFTRLKVQFIGYLYIYKALRLFNSVEIYKVINMNLQENLETHITFLFLDRNLLFSSFFLL